MPIAYVTGADRGLGLALTRGLLDRGYRVFAGSYLPDWPELGQLAASEPERLTVLPLDISDEASVNAAAAFIASRTDRLDVLINNAGIHNEPESTILDDLNFPYMLKEYSVNALGPLRVTHSVIRLLLAGEGRKLVNIGSEAGSVSGNWRTHTYGYTMSKSALNMQSAILQLHLKEFGVKVLCLHPGWVRSYMSGEKNLDAALEPEVPAEGILRLIETEHDPEGPLYMDYTGAPMSW
ncbi:SDR family NAD(P)-dependent oxidoreductase [Gorillibacterium sp. sgz500922]|uniref:SDR family NAD(P)-dependent oxidoreductase n=1 Tax=Gorillibacterium sp. sgz500922 TaxID=3446694 RepID=UPI003F661C18